MWANRAHHIEREFEYFDQIGIQNPYLFFFFTANNNLFYIFPIFLFCKLKQF